MIIGSIKMSKHNSVTLKVKSELEKLEDRIVHKGGVKVGLTKKNKSKSKRQLKIEKKSRHINRR
jgi:hypothetical protein